MDPTTAARLEEFLDDVLDHPEKYIPRVREAVQKIRARAGGLLRDLGVEDPAKDAAYASAVATVLTAFIVSDVSDTSDRLEGLSREMLEETRRLRLQTNDLLEEAKTLRRLTTVLVGTTAVLAILTVLLIFRPVL